jgi:leucyl aminopeptidase
MPRLALSPVAPERADADLLVLPVAAGPDGPVALPVTAAVLERLGTGLAAATAGGVRGTAGVAPRSIGGVRGTAGVAPRSIGGVRGTAGGVPRWIGGAGRFTGKLDDVVVLPSYGALAAPAVLLVGVGPDDGRSPETLRRAAAVAVAAAGKAATLAVALHHTDLPDAPGDPPGGPPDPPDRPGDPGVALAAVAEGIALAAYRFQRHKSAPDPDLAAVTLLVDGAALAAAGPVLRRAEVATRATLAARDLVNEPASRINPATLAAEAVRLARAAGLEHQVLTGPALRRGRFGAVLAVGGGSATGPRLVELRYRPPGAGRHVALVGKGVTFDTGGIDLKRGAGMDGMKDDMAGAAAILAAVTAAAELELPTAVTAILPLVENMPGASAMRPGDVLTARNGITVEVTNTDAEGRLILADGLALAAEARPDAILDLATLTGSVVYGLGLGCTGVFGNTPALTAEVLAAAGRAGELACELPLIEDYRRFLDSEVADLLNATNEPGDSVQAALFLREFVAGIPWAHLDIAGPATAKEARYYQPKGASGWGVRTLLAFLDGPR